MEELKKKLDDSFVKKDEYKDIFYLKKKRKEFKILKMIYKIG